MAAAVALALALATSEAESRILSVLEEMRAGGRTYLSVPPADGRALALLTEAVDAKSVVEIGTSTGYSGLWFCLALQRTGGRLTTFEIDRGRASAARRNFQQAGVDGIVTIVEGDAHETIGAVKGPIDVVFIDADKEGYVDYLRKLLPLVRPGGLILAHNVDMVADYMKAVTTSADLETIVYREGAGLAVTLKNAAVPERRVLIVMDEREQMEALARYLKDEGGLDVIIVDQKSMPEDWSRFAAVIGYIHGALLEPTELKIIDYTRAGGRYVGLHHSISSGKTKNKHYFDFLGVRLAGIEKAREPAAAGDHYAWREGIDFQVVNLNPGHYITSNGVVWPEKTAYRDREYPALTLKHAEAYMNVQFTDEREKTVLLGFKYLDDRNGVLYMQDREGWLKPAGKGWIVYLQMGHTTAEFENPAVAQMVLNAVNWKP